MERAKVKVIRFDDSDVIATGALNTIAFTGIGDIVKGNATVSINGATPFTADADTAAMIGKIYGIDHKATNVFYKEGNQANMVWSLEQALSTSVTGGERGGNGGDCGIYNDAGYKNWNHTFYYNGGKFYREIKQ